MVILINFLQAFQLYLLYNAMNENFEKKKFRFLLKVPSFQPFRRHNRKNLLKKRGIRFCSLFAQLSNPFRVNALGLIPSPSKFFDLIAKMAPLQMANYLVQASPGRYRRNLTEGTDKSRVRATERQSIKQSARDKIPVDDNGQQLIILDIGYLI